MDICGGGYLRRRVSAAVDILQGGVRDIVCAGEFWTQLTAAIKGWCAISGLLQAKGGVGARYRGGRWTAAIQARVCDIVCAGGALDPFANKGGRAISSVQGDAGLLQSRGGARDIVCAVVCAVKGGARYRLRAGVLDCCNQSAGARYRLAGRVLDPCCN